MPVATPADLGRPSPPFPAAPAGWAPRVLLAAALVVAAVPLLDVLGDPDVWWHIRLGRWILDNHAVPRGELFSYTAAGASVTPHEWGAEVLFDLLYSAGGLFLLGLVVCILGWSGLVAIALRARARGAPDLAVAVAVLLGAKAMQPVAGTRPQVLSFAVACWALFLVDRYTARGGRSIWLLPPLLLVGANLHAGFVAALALVGVVLVVEAARTRLGVRGAASAARVRGLAAVTGVAALAACVNANGPGIYRYALLGSADESRKPITEWHSPDFHSSADLGLFALLLAWVLLAAVLRGPGVRDAVLGVLGFGAALLAVRNISLCVAVAVPGLAVMLGDAWSGWAPPRLRSARLRLRPASLAILGSGALVILGVGLSRLASDSRDAAVAARYPECTARLLAASGTPVTVFAAYADGGYLIDRAWPQVHVYAYGADDSLGPAVIDDYVRIAAGVGSDPSALSLLDRSRTAAVLTPAGGDLDGVLAADRRWHRVADDHGRDLWLREASVAPAAC